MTSKGNVGRALEHSRAVGGAGMGGDSVPPRRAQGRPRAPEKEEAILAATLAVMAERGYRGMTIPAVAEAAGVGKPTIYLRFPSKFELAMAALATLPVVEGPRDTGSTRTDLLALLQERQDAIERLGFSIVGAVLVEEVGHPELLERFQDQLFRPLANSIRVAIRRGIERGEVRADADVDAVVNLLNGAQLSQHLVGEPMPRDWAERAVDVLWASMEPRTGRGDSPTGPSRRRATRRRRASGGAASGSEIQEHRDP
jgi:AcrR family transcriptional regulator